LDLIILSFTPVCKKPQAITPGVFVILITEVYINIT
jgi:hypothetical protein